MLRDVGVGPANTCLPVCIMAPSSGGLAAAHADNVKILQSEHGPFSPGSAACLFRDTGGVTMISSVRRILRKAGLPGKAHGQLHGSVIALLPEGFVVRKQPGPMSTGCFRCADCGDQRVRSEVKRIVQRRLHLDSCNMPVGGGRSRDGAAQRLRANNEVQRHAAVCWHDVEHFNESGAVSTNLGSSFEPCLLSSTMVVKLHFEEH